MSTLFVFGYSEYSENREALISKRGFDFMRSYKTDKIRQIRDSLDLFHDVCVHQRGKMAV